MTQPSLLYHVQLEMVGLLWEESTQTGTRITQAWRLMS